MTNETQTTEKGKLSKRLLLAIGYAPEERKWAYEDFRIMGIFQDLDSMLKLVEQSPIGRYKEVSDWNPNYCKKQIKYQRQARGLVPVDTPLDQTLTPLGFWLTYSHPKVGDVANIEYPLKTEQEIQVRIQERVRSALEFWEPIGKKDICFPFIYRVYDLETAVSNRLDKKSEKITKTFMTRNNLGINLKAQ